MVKRNLHPISGNYTFLLSGLLFLFFLMPLLRSFPVIANNSFLMGIGLKLGYSALMLLGVWSMHEKKKIFWFGFTLAALSILFSAFGILYHGVVFDLFEVVVVLLFSIISSVITFKDVFKSTKVDSNMLLGAACVYLLLGLIWALLYGLILVFWPSSFNGMENIHGSVPFDNLLYYSFVTLASLGYGDITPMFPLARTFAYMEAIVGQLYIAIMLAGLVALYMSDLKSRRQ